MRLAIVLLLATAASAHADPTAELDAADLDFGALDFNTTEVRYVTVANIGAAPRSPLVVTSAQIAGTGEITFASGTCAGATTCAFAPALSITGTAALVPVQCTASEPGATITATITFTSNSDDTQHSTAQLTCTVRSSTVSFAPPSLAFGNVDMRATKMPTLYAHLENQTSAAVGITSLAITGPAAAQFTTPIAAGAIAPANGALSIPISYTPSAENVRDDAVLALTLALPTGPATIQADLSGTGVDRHAMLVALPTFPETLLEPGYAATEEPITIANTGGAVLQLSNATITGAPIWSFAHPGPVDLPGNSTYQMLVRFAPTAVGPAPTATFSIDTNDPRVPVITGTVGGVGIDRQATMTPAVVELDYAGVGWTVYGSDPSRDVAITVTNDDPARTYTISGIRVFGGEGAFDVLGASGPLPPGASRSFDVAFTPPHAGEFTATAALFLDFDPTPEATVTLHGTGDFVSAHGDGGCSAGGNAGGGAIVAIAIAALIRRRRRAALALLVVVAATGAAHAQTRDLDLAVFDPAPTTTAAPTFALPTADVGPDGAWVVAATVSFARDPLVLTAPTNDNAVLRDRTTLALGGAFAFAEQFEVAVHVPIYFQGGQDLSSATMYGEPAVSAAAFGDLELDGKALFSRYRGPAGDLATGVSVGLQLPTANSQEFAGSAKPEGRGLALVRYAPPILGERVALELDAGGVVRGSARYDDIHQQSGFDWGAALRVTATRHLGFAAEAYGELVPGGIVDEMGGTRVLHTAEALVGAHYQVDRRVNVGVAIGHGLTDAIGSPGYMGVVMVTVAPMARYELAAPP